jgi:hypothetical protein
MAVQQIDISLIASHGDGRPVTSNEFIRPLAPTDSDGLLRVVADRGKWASGLVEFVRTDDVKEAYKDADEPSDAFAKDLARSLGRIAAWLGRRTVALRKMAKSGLDPTLIVSMWIDQDQMDLVLPPDLLRACGEGGVRIQLITNQ